MTTTLAKADFLKPCPFCGGEATVESTEGATMSVQSGAWSVGCSDDDGHCYGYQSLQTFARRSEAITAWNKRYVDGAIISLVTPDNLQLGHTWLKRKLFEAINSIKAPTTIDI